MDEALAAQLVDEDIEIDMDTSKNNRMDKNAKEGDQERCTEEI